MHAEHLYTCSNPKSGNCFSTSFYSLIIYFKSWWFLYQHIRLYRKVRKKTNQNLAIFFKSKKYIISTSALRQNQFELSSPEHLNHGTNDAHIPVLRVHPYLSSPIQKATKINLYFFYCFYIFKQATI